MVVVSPSSGQLSLRRFLGPCSRTLQKYTAKVYQGYIQTIPDISQSISKYYLQNTRLRQSRPARPGPEAPVPVRPRGFDAPVPVRQVYLASSNRPIVSFLSHSLHRGASDTRRIIALVTCYHMLYDFAPFSGYHLIVIAIIGSPTFRYK